MKPKPLLALNHFTVPCSLLTAVLVSVSWVTAEHYMFKLSDASSSEPLNRASAVFKPCVTNPQSKPIAQKKAASLTSRPLYNPKAIQEQQTQKQSTTGYTKRQAKSYSLCLLLVSAFGGFAARAKIRECAPASRSSPSSPG